MTVRNTLDEASSVVARGEFTTGDTVTISIYLNNSATAESLTSSSAIEHSTSGVFYWEFSNLTTAPSVYSDYLFILTNGITTVIGNQVFGGWPNTVDSNTGANVVTITVEEIDTTAISSVQVQLYDSTQTTVLDTKETDTSGQVVFAADDGNYIVILRKNQTTFTVPESLIVLGTTSQTYNGTPLTISNAVGAGECNVVLFSSAQDPSAFLTSLLGTATITDLPTLISEEFFPGTKVTGTYFASTGELNWILPRTAVVQFVVNDLGISETKTIPDVASISYSDI